ncbi:dihydroorotase [Mangrovihabitans endophyticus]|uniref:Dihydroorotase n=1 Tax=Mangrovihabitans endophyticus TaxID=1751298 RepID=A0A8J3BWX3_9ACTN|nr:dihydroorotase family protein [Mangrovihabitans endophyticus]GGK74030.1 dihydroorotase [Mangrovihabitans endophyticus]
MKAIEGRLVTPQGVRPGRVLIEHGRIAAVDDLTTPVPPGVPVVAARDAYVLPGLIDPHVHFRTPGLTHKEDWGHGSRAAVAGGVTTVMDMPNTRPASFTAKALIDKAALIEGRSLVDFAFHIGVDPEHPEALADLDTGTARSAKIFMAGHHTAPAVLSDPAALDTAFAAAARSGVRVVLHAEDGGLFDLLDAWWGEPGGYRDYEARRPRTGGIAAVAKVIELVRRHGTAAHVLHLSSAEEADLVCAAQAAGLPVTFELTGHHLSFTDADTCRVGARTRLAPAIRGVRDQDRLWRAVFGEQAATLGSDHAPHTVAEKTRSVADSPPGLPGVQELATAVWTGMRRRAPEEDADAAIGRLVRLMASGPADLFGLPGKGRITPGADADLVLFAPDDTWMFSAAQVRSKCGWSAYEGWTMTGRVRRTFRRGEQVFDAATGAYGAPDGAWLR